MSFSPFALVLMTNPQTLFASERVERVPHACLGLTNDKIKIVVSAT